MKSGKVYKSLLLSILFLPLAVYSQQEQNPGLIHKTDSIQNVLKHEKEDTARVNTLNILCFIFYSTGDYHRADSLAQLTLNLALRLNYPMGISYAYRNIANNYYVHHQDSLALINYTKSYKIAETAGDKKCMGDNDDEMGLVYAHQGRYPEALEYYNKAIQLLELINAKGELYRIYQHIGVIYKKQGNYPEAAKNYLLSMKGAEAANDKQIVADNYMNLGNVATETGNDSDAMKDYMLAYKVYEAMGNRRGMGNAYGNIGNLYVNKDKDTEALVYYTKSLDIAKQINDKDGMSDAYGNMGNIYNNRGDHEQALKYETLSLQLDEEMSNKEGLTEDYIMISSILLSEKKYSAVSETINKASVFAKEIGSKRLLDDCYTLMVGLDTITKNFKSAFFDYTKFIAYRDSMRNEETTKKLVKEQMNYEFDKKQAIEQAQQEKKDTIAAAEKRRQEVIIVFISIGLLLVIVFSGLLFSRFRVTQKQKSIIEKQKLLVEEKNKEVTDSITYAKRLQDAILPPLNVIKKHLPESFVSYKPKDIVAGDFYWMETALLNPPDRRKMASSPSEGGNKDTEEIPLSGRIQGAEAILIAAADCTGHGVPGAMVSVVCSNALNRTVKEFRITETGKILDKVRELVVETFERSESDVKDGMDISLASIIHLPNGNVQLQWSGAYNPLWYIQDGKINEVAPDKQPIGKQDKSKPFTTHNLTLSKGDTLYLFTDGYADQFGGPEGKKFKSKQLQEKLLSIASLSMDKQKEMLEQTLLSWKGSLEQVDDILIIGIRV